MKVNFNKVTRALHKVGFKIKKHSPEILMVAGGIGVVTSTIMACKATLKVNEVLDEAKENVEKIHEATEHGITAAGKEYTKEDSAKDLTIVYAQTGIKLAKLYGPAIIVGTLSLASILTSHKIMRKRNVALLTAYTAVDKGFKEYRGRVVERFGERIDHELKYNIKAKEIEREVINEDGTVSTVKEVVDVCEDPTNQYSEFSVIFDESSQYFEKDASFNKMFLVQTEREANRTLQTRGYLFLNEVYRMLGLPETKVGQSFGWVYDEHNPIGDNYVDFKIFNLHREANRDFVNGYEKYILLDFNVDGDIVDLVW